MTKKLNSKNQLMDCSKINEILNVDGPDFITLPQLEGESGYAGKLNGFYGKKHTEETKQLLREKTLELLKNEKFKMSRICVGEKNGMYGKSRSGDLNPMFGKKHSEEARKKMSEKAKLRLKK
jgi:hypothetical protein